MLKSSSHEIKVWKTIVNSTVTVNEAISGSDVTKPSMV